MTPSAEDILAVREAGSLRSFYVDFSQLVAKSTCLHSSYLCETWLFSWNQQDVQGIFLTGVPDVEFSAEDLALELLFLFSQQHAHVRRGLGWTMDHRGRIGVLFENMPWTLATYPGHRFSEKVPLPVRVYLAQQLAEGLAHLHAAGVVHGDVCLEQAFVTRDFRVQLGGYGLFGAQSVLAVTEDSILPGRMAYASPDLLHANAPTQRADLYALGIAILNTIFGSQPAGTGALATLSTGSHPELFALARRACEWPWPPAYETRTLGEQRLSALRPVLQGLFRGGVTAAEAAAALRREAGLVGLMGERRARRLAAAFLDPSVSLPQGAPDLPVLGCACVLTRGRHGGAAAAAARADAANAAAGCGPQRR
jgi:hypothetical protein